MTNNKRQLFWLRLSESLRRQLQKLQHVHMASGSTLRMRYVSLSLRTEPTARTTHDNDADDGRLGRLRRLAAAATRCCECRFNFNFSSRGNLNANSSVPVGQSVLQRFAQVACELS